MLVPCGKQERVRRVCGSGGMRMPPTICVPTATAIWKALAGLPLEPEAIMSQRPLRVSAPPLWCSRCR